MGLHPIPDFAAAQTSLWHGLYSLIPQLPKPGNPFFMRLSNDFLIERIYHLPELPALPEFNQGMGGALP
jgi:hypothetical protein